MVVSKRVLFVSLFMLVHMLGTAEPSLGQSAGEQRKASDELAVQLIVGTDPDNKEIISGTYSSPESQGETYWASLWNEFRKPSTQFELAKEVATERLKIVREAAGKGIRITEQELATLKARLIKCGLSEYSAARALEPIRHRIEEAMRGGKANMVVFLLKTSTSAAIDYLIENSMQGRPLTSEELRALKPKRPQLDETAIAPANY